MDHRKQLSAEKGLFLSLNLDFSPWAQKDLDFSTPRSLQEYGCYELCFGGSGNLFMGHRRQFPRILRDIPTFYSPSLIIFGILSSKVLSGFDEVLKSWTQAEALLRVF